jgi:hypothetical protein
MRHFRAEKQSVVGIQRFICLDGSIYVVMYLCSVMGPKTKVTPIQFRTIFCNPDSDTGTTYPLFLSIFFSIIMYALNF